MRIGENRGWGAAGVVLALRRHGLIKRRRFAWSPAWRRLRAGRFAIAALTDSARTVLAALFLIFPGVVSDLIALTLLLLPGPRAVADSVVRRPNHGTLIEGEFRRTR